MNSCKNGGWASAMESVNSFMTAYHILGHMIVLEGLGLQEA